MNEQAYLKKVPISESVSVKALGSLITHTIPNYEMSSRVDFIRFPKDRYFKKRIGVVAVKEGFADIYFEGEFKKKDFKIFFEVPGHVVIIDFYIFHHLISWAAERISEGAFYVPKFSEQIQGPHIFHVLPLMLKNLNHSYQMEWKLGFMEYREYVREFFLRQAINQRLEEDYE